MGRQTLRDRVHRYNDEGIEGLKSRRRPGLAPWLTAAQNNELKTLVIVGPDPRLHKAVRCRCVNLHVEIARRFSVTVQESTVGAWLPELGLTRLQPRPDLPKKNLKAQETYKKDFSDLACQALGSTACSTIEIWFQDEARIGQKGVDLVVPDNITLRPLPPYPLELNPTESIWEDLRGNKLCSLVWDSY